MRIVNFVSRGKESYGVVVGDGVVEASHSLRDRYPTLLALVVDEGVDALAHDVRSGSAEPVLLDTIELLPPLRQPGKIICIGNNYHAHATESGGRGAAHPPFFIRFPDTLVAAGARVIRPRLSEQFDFEGELAVVIGRAGRHIAPAVALEHVLGYSCFMDGSIRDYQFEHSLCAGKNFPATAGFGPWIATTDEVPDPDQLEIVTRLAGAEVQRGYTKDMIFGTRALISYLSSITPLNAGDVIATGTPEGVGFARNPPIWLRHADVIEVDIAPIGCLRVHVTDEAEAS